jgi:cytidylate kinase
MAKSYGQLIPSIERRLSAWIALGERRSSAAAPASRPTVTISRRFGCEGFPLAERIKAAFEARSGEVWTIFDKALLDLVSEHEQVAPKVFADLGGPSRRADAIGFLVTGYVPHSQLFQRIPKHILRIAAVGNAIIVGRGGAIVTQKLSNCYHFRLEGSVEFRVASIARRLALPEAEARKLVRQNEHAREAFIEECLGASPSDPSYYDAVFNNARHGVAEIAQGIVAYVTEAWARHPKTGQTVGAVSTV